MRLTTAPLLLDVLLYCPRGAPAHALPQALARTLVRQLHAARRAACHQHVLAGLGPAESRPGAAMRQAAARTSGREEGPGYGAGLGPAADGEHRGGRQGSGSGVGRLAVRALHFAPGALGHPVTLLQPLLPAEPEVRRTVSVLSSLFVRGDLHVPRVGPQPSHLGWTASSPYSSLSDMCMLACARISISTRMQPAACGLGSVMSTE